MATFFIILFLVLLIISVLINVNLLFKLEKFELDNEEMDDYIRQLELWINQFTRKVNESYSQIKNIDRKGAFESDDEVGFVFKELKGIVSDLTKLTKESDAEETEQENKN